MAEQQKRKKKKKPQNWEPKNIWVFFLPLSCLTCSLGNWDKEVKKLAQS